MLAGDKVLKGGPGDGGLKAAGIRKVERCNLSPLREGGACQMALNCNMVAEETHCVAEVLQWEDPTAGIAAQRM